MSAEPRIARLEDAWPLLVERCPPIIDGRPARYEQVSAEIEAGRAVLLSNDDGILLLALEPGLDGRGDTLIAWCAVAARRADEGCAAGEYLPQIEQWAAQIGARRVVLQSPRRGWLRRLPERWRVTSVTYECEVTDGGKEQGHRTGD